MKFLVKITTLALLMTSLQVGAANFKATPDGFIAACKTGGVKTTNQLRASFFKTFGTQPALCTNDNIQAVQAINAFLGTEGNFNTTTQQFASAEIAQKFIDLPGMNTALFQARIFPSNYYQIALQQLETAKQQLEREVENQTTIVTGQAGAIQQIKDSVDALGIDNVREMKLNQLVAEVKGINTDEKEARDYLNTLSIAYDAATNKFVPTPTADPDKLARYVLKGYIEKIFAKRLQMMAVPALSPTHPVVSLVQLPTTQLDVTALDPMTVPNDYKVVETQVTALFEAMAHQINETDAVLGTAATSLNHALPAGTLALRTQDLIVQLKNGQGAAPAAAGTTASEAAVTDFLKHLINPAEWTDATIDTEPIFIKQNFKMDALNIKGKTMDEFSRETYSNKMTIVGSLMRGSLEFTQNMLNLTGVVAPQTDGWTGTKQMTDAITIQITGWKTAATAGNAAGTPTAGASNTAQAVKNALTKFREDLISRTGERQFTAFDGTFTLTDLTTDAPTDASRSKQIGDYFRKCAEAANVLKTLAEIGMPATMKDLITQSEQAIRARMVAAPAAAAAAAAIPPAVIDGHNAAVAFAITEFNGKGEASKQVMFLEDGIIRSLNAAAEAMNAITAGIARTITFQVSDTNAAPLVVNGENDITATTQAVAA